MVRKIVRHDIKEKKKRKKKRKERKKKRKKEKKEKRKKETKKRCTDTPISEGGGSVLIGDCLGMRRYASNYSKPRQLFRYASVCYKLF